MTHIFILFYGILIMLPVTQTGGRGLEEVTATLLHVVMNAFWGMRTITLKHNVGIYIFRQEFLYDNFIYSRLKKFVYISCAELYWQK
jgi:hypothetical protein